jgi:NTP pyrophosphatase (non-canonical NTP hydrolase)
MMMTEHEPVPGTEYYGDDHYDTQEQDEEEMSQWYEFDAYQDFTDTTAIYPPEKGLEYTALGLASEAGEFAGKVKKAIRDNNWDTDAMAAELGDVLWYVARAAAELDIHLSSIAKENIDKLKSRKARDVIKGEGDNR